MKNTKIQRNYIGHIPFLFTSKYTCPNFMESSDLLEFLEMHRYSYEDEGRLKFLENFEDFVEKKVQWISRNYSAYVAKKNVSICFRFF